MQKVSIIDMVHMGCNMEESYFGGILDSWTEGLTMEKVRVVYIWAHLYNVHIKRNSIYRKVILKVRKGQLDRGEGQESGWGLTEEEESLVNAYCTSLPSGHPSPILWHPLEKKQKEKLFHTICCKKWRKGDWMRIALACPVSGHPIPILLTSAWEKSKE